MRLSRRSIIRTGLLAAASPALGRFGLPLAAPAVAQEQDWRHALSLFGDLKYPPGFKHFEYASPSAPKGGTVRLSTRGTFDNFNVVVSGVKGAIASGIGLLFDSLTVESLDEESSAYGLLAEAVRHPADFSSVTYRLRAEARFHDGKRSPSTLPAIASCRASSGSSASCRSIGGKRPTAPATSAMSPPPRSSRCSETVPTGSRNSSPAARSCSSVSGIIGARM